MPKSLRLQNTIWCSHLLTVQRAISGLESYVTLSPMGFYCSSYPNVGSGGAGQLSPWTLWELGKSQAAAKSASHLGNWQRADPLCMQAPIHRALPPPRLLFQRFCSGQRHGLYSKALGRPLQEGSFLCKPPALQQFDTNTSRCWDLTAGSNSNHNHRDVFFPLYSTVNQYNGVSGDMRKDSMYLASQQWGHLCKQVLLCLCYPIRKRFPIITQETLWILVIQVTKTQLSHQGIWPQTGNDCHCTTTISSQDTLILSPRRLLGGVKVKPPEGQ